MTILARLYASSGQERIIPTLEVSDGTEQIRITDGWQDVTAGIEGGDQVEFTAVGMELSLPDKNEDGTQDLTFALSNITGEVSAFLKPRIQSRTRMTLTYREYIDTDLSLPVKPASIYEVKGGSWDVFQATITAGYFNILETSWPRRVMTLNEFPGLRYV